MLLCLYCAAPCNAFLPRADPAAAPCDDDDGGDGDDDVHASPDGDDGDGAGDGDHGGDCDDDDDDDDDDDGLCSYGDGYIDSAGGGRGGINTIEAL